MNTEGKKRLLTSGKINSRLTCIERLEEKSMQKGKLKHNTSAHKHGGSIIMAPACMAANGTMSLVVTDDLTADRSSRSSRLASCYL